MTDEMILKGYMILIILDYLRFFLDFRRNKG